MFVDIWLERKSEIGVAVLLCDFFCGREREMIITKDGERGRSSYGERETKRERERKRCLNLSEVVDVICDLCVTYDNCKIRVKDDMSYLACALRQAF